MDKYEQLKQKIDEAKTKSLVRDEMRTFAELLISATNKTKKELSDLSQENIKVIKESIAFIEDNYQKWTNTQDTKTNAMVGEFDAKIAVLKGLMEEVKTLKPKDGVDGLDADEEVIVEKVLEKIKLPEQKEVILDDGKQIADKLNVLEEVIDQKVIKGLTKKITDLSSNIAHSAVKSGAKLYTGVSETRVRELIATIPSTSSTGGASTLADVSSFSTDATKSLYTMTSTIPVEFKRSGGASLLYLDETNGRVGIGTTNLDTKLYVNGTGHFSDAVNFGASSGLAAIKLASWDLLRWDTSNQVSFGGISVGTWQVLKFYTDNSERMRIDASGNVGIGTTAPGEKLTVSGNININTASSLMIFSQNAQTNKATMQQISGSFQMSANAYYDGSAWQRYDTSFPSWNLYITPDANDGFVIRRTAAGSGAITFTNFLKITNTGNVGIGTTAPSQKLDILDASNPQLRLINVDGATYADFYTDSGGNLNITPTGGRMYLVGTGGVSSYIGMTHTDNSANYLAGIGVDTGTAPMFGVVVSDTLGGGITTRPFFSVSSSTGTPFIAFYNKVGLLDATTPTYDLSIGGTVARTISTERNTTAATAGQGLTLASGGAIAGTADLAGGDLTLKSGISTGSGSSAIHFYTATAGASATTDRTPTEKMTILGSGNVGIGTTAPTSTLHNAGSLTVFYRAITALRTLDATDYFIDCTANTFAVTLPTAVNIPGRTYVIKNSGTGIITIDTTSSQTIDGSTTYTLSTQYQSVTVVSDNANWKVI